MRSVRSSAHQLAGVDERVIGPRRGGTGVESVKVAGARRDAVGQRYPEVLQAVPFTRQRLVYLPGAAGKGVGLTRLVRFRVCD